VSRSDVLDVPGGNGFTRGVFALPTLHLVGHQHTHFNFTVNEFGANAHWVSHDELLKKYSSN
jgi:hypothetical protein